jgi:hypothetical protein
MVLSLLRYTFREEEASWKAVGDVERATGASGDNMGAAPGWGQGPFRPRVRLAGDRR